MLGTHTLPAVLPDVAFTYEFLPETRVPWLWGIYHPKEMRYEKEALLRRQAFAALLLADLFFLLWFIPPTPYMLSFCTYGRGTRTLGRMPLTRRHGLSCASVSWSARWGAC